jgi:hypothetical protein
LTDVTGPVIIDGHFANNDPTRYFLGGTVLQRPGLAMVGNNIVAGFGGHCDNFNYTGMLVSVSKTTGTVNNIQAMVASPGQAPHAALSLPRIFLSLSLRVFITSQFRGHELTESAQV